MRSSGPTLIAIVAVMVLLMVGAPAFAQAPPCPAPPITPPPNVPNMFSEQQENDLGDAAAESVQRYFKVIDDDVTENLRRIGQRLVQQLPPTQLKFRFLLMDVPTVNAFGMPGGYIYVSRKLVAASRSEDEVAGVLAHEIGHIITRQLAVRYTRLMSKVLGISSVGDRKDIFEKYQQWLENVARNPKALKETDREDEDEQFVADKFAIYLGLRAGYDIEAYSKFWDRAFEVRGKTGGFFSDLFGTTKPEQKRLREMRRLASTMPASCAGPRPQMSQEQYDAWRADVLAYSGLGRPESLHAVTWKRPLTPQLRGYITHLKFSRDGKYLLAQDASSIFVLTRDPFAVQFRIDAQDSFPAQFTPDSQAVVFYTSELRVEKWNIADERRESLQDMTMNIQCQHAELSPDGDVLACFDTQYGLNLIDIASGTRILQKKDFFIPTIFEYINRLLQVYISGLDLNQLKFIGMDFSPDGKHFLAARDRDTYLAYDLSAKATIKLPDSIRRLPISFKFMDGERIVGVMPQKTEESAVMSYPAGEIQMQFNPGGASVAPATHGLNLFIRPITNYPVGVMNLETKKIYMANKQDAIDLYDKVYVSERTDGVLFLFHVDQVEALGQTALPQSPLPRVRTAAISDDFNWLAVSERSRGAIWDLRKGQRAMLTRGFRGAYFSQDSVLYADFPKAGAEERMIARVNPAIRSMSPAAQLKKTDAHQDGRFLVELRKASGEGKEKKPPTVVVSDVRTGLEMWSRAYPKGLPYEFFNSETDLGVFIWGARSDFTREEAKTDSPLRSLIDSKKESQNDYYLHVVEASTGKVVGKVYVETGMGSFLIRYAFATGDYVVVSDTKNRVLVYSISTGKQLGRIFGAWADLSLKANLLVAENERGVLSFYTLPALEKTGQLVFSSPISYIRFSEDGKRLFILTSNQQAYLFDLPGVLAQTKTAVK